MNWRRLTQPFKRRVGEAEPVAGGSPLPLREFVYLDEVSVYSLLASTTGAITAEQTETATGSHMRRFEGAAGGTLGLAQAEIRSQLESSTTQGTQVLRKSIVQGTFKELIEFESDRLLLRDGATALAPPKAESLAAASKLDPEARGYHLVPCSALERGRLLELEVELTAESIFLASRVISTMIEFFEEVPEFFGVDRSTLEQGRAVDKMLRRMLVGLVPIRGTSTNYRLVSLSGSDWLASTALLEALSSDPAAREAEPVHVVGVAEEGLFWRDLRRVLFAGSRYFVMCRVGETGVQTKWTPVKLAEIFATFAPNVAEIMDQAGQSFLEGAAAGASQTDEALGHPAQVLARIAARLADEVGEQWTEEDQAGLMQRMNVVELESLEDQRAAVEPIVTKLEARSGKPLTAELVSDIRYQEFARAELLETAEAAEGPFSASAVEGSDLLIDTEIVAIYW